MADNPPPEDKKKTQAGTAEKQTVLQLQPVKYKLTLVYMGHERIEREAATGSSLPKVKKPPPYRCRYELRKGADAGDALLDTVQEIPNQVRKGTDDDASKKAATPAADGGDWSQPASDEVYKVRILDNHGTRTAENLDLLGNNGDKNSNIKYFKDRGWLPDVFPAVPLRVVVRKFVGDEQVDFDNKKLKVIAEVKNPVEEFDQNDGRRRDFIQDFFDKYNRTDTTPDPGDDNALTWFQGHRAPSASHPGVSAKTVLRKIKYKDKPAVDVHTAENKDIINFKKDTSSAKSHKKSNASFDLEEVEEEVGGDKKKVGIADMAFVPWPAGGDKFRMLFSLWEGNCDVRETKENGKDVEVVDDDDKPIEKPRSYVTGRFLIWRKTEFKLCVLTNNTAEADIDWDDITAMYRKMFVEVVKPEKTVTLTREAWARTLKSLYSSVPNINDNAHYTEAVYNATLFPDVVATSAGFNGFDAVESFGREAIKQACADEGIDDPSAGNARKDQRDGNGMFMFLCKDPRVGSVLGAYVGDRIFWMRKADPPNSAAKSTSTCAHEFGHVKSLRHAHTNTDAGWYMTAPAAPTQTIYINPHVNNQPIDHDAKDAFACLMSYTRPIDAEPCGLCALSMRFYDRVEIQKGNRFQDEILERSGPVTIATYSTSGAGDVVLTPVPGPIPLSTSTQVDQTQAAAAILARDDSSRGQGAQNTGRGLAEDPMEELSC